MPLDVWQQRIAEASTMERLLYELKAFLATLQPADIALLPKECRTAVVVDGEQLAHLALRLARLRLESDSASIHRVATVFACASQRATQISTYARLRAATAANSE